MFPFPWRSTYLQYKEDTDAVASWLARTARRCGYSGDLLSKGEDAENEEGDPDTKPAHSHKSKSKGKKKTKARSQQPKPVQPPEPQTTPSAPRKPSYLISIPAFTILAEFIAKSKNPVVQAPTSLVHVLDRAISLRKQFSKSLTDKATPKNGWADKSHSYFVHVLEEVKKILGNSTHVSSGAYSASDLANSFAGLMVEEPSQEFLNAPAPTPDVAVEPEFKSDQFEDPNEVFLAFKLLMEDFSTIRNAVAQIWEDHMAGKHRSVAAALATNMAIDFARKMEEDMADLVERFGGFDQVYRVWWSAICQDRGYSENHREKEGDALNFRAYEEANTAMLPAHLMLTKFISLVPSDPKSSPDIGMPGPIDYASDWKSKTPREKYLHDEALLNQVLASLVSAIRVPGHRNKGLPGEDELIRGLRVAIETRQVSLWNVLSVQILLDIHHCQRQDIQLPWKELNAVGSHLSRTIDIVSKELQGLRHPNWTESNDEAVKEQRKDIEDWVINDKVQKSILRFKRRAPGKHFHFKNNPVFCGLFIYSLQMRYHIISIDYANTWKAVLNARHLYNAFRQEDLIKSKCADMEVFQLVQPDSVSFAGDAPKKKEDYIKRYAIMNGMSAASFSKDARGPPKRSAAGCR
ncbi:uncharacterized protein BKA78DRAFT_342461 [Phyllosticta capitalensis]|uniref:uncharacterized protein n=1 Tax=Phyllosticta capitalensis TaxID=121624 RepID=UPI0031312FBF